MVTFYNIIKFNNGFNLQTANKLSKKQVKRLAKRLKGFENLVSTVHTVIIMIQ